MRSKQTLVTALCELADELARAHRSRDGFSLLKEPVGVRTRLEPKFPDEPWDDVDFEDLCGLKIDRLIYFAWEAGPGASSELSYATLQLPSGRRLYLMHSDNEDQPLIMSVTKKKWTPRMDLKFLQYQFRGARMGRAAPSEISTFLPFPFLIDLFITSFNATDWRDLLKYFNDEGKLWNEEYENPSDPRPPEDISSPTLMAGAEYRKALSKAVKQTRLHSDFNKKRPDDPDARKRIVARFLAQVIKAGMRWRASNTRKQAQIRSSATPAANTPPLFQRLKLPPNFKDVTSAKFGTMFGLVGPPFRPKK